MTPWEIREGDALERLRDRKTANEPRPNVAVSESAGLVVLHVNGERIGGLMARVCVLLYPDEAQDLASRLGDAAAAVRDA